MSHDRYQSPLSTRYASDRMQYLFSEEFKFKTFRRLWLSLAKAEKELGVNITDEQIAELEAASDLPVDFDLAAKYEKETRHDVMAQILALGDICPKARPIIHLGATSCFVGDNTDIVIMANALKIIKAKLLKVAKNLADFAKEYRSLPTLGYTHLQPAQLTTVGKRATLWLYDIVSDIEDIDYVLSNLKLLGSKGTTGTQASFMEIFSNDEEKVKKLDSLIAKDMGFDACVPVSGQTYSRKVDSKVVKVLSGIAESSYKFAEDMRILQSFKELEEPFEKSQVGSSAMPYKRNPMRCERICALSRYLISDMQNCANTAACQMLERTLDDSANRRIAISEAFLCADAILNIYINVSSGIVVYPEIIKKRITAELPFIASENILMDCVMRGGDRQKMHELIRKHSMEAGKRVKELGKDNDLIDLIAADERFGISKAELEKLLEPSLYTGRAASQTDEFLSDTVYPLLKRNADLLSACEDFELQV
ncbi:MAG: adenylosuccinate lyase [Clostridia bacterium]|nr:adenylosuccinate lyase [Clostridia bacterium]